MAGEYGDGTLISYTQADGSIYDILVDAGPYDNSDYMPDFLRENVTDHVLDLVVLSHQHADHYGGFQDSALQNGGITEVRQIVDNGVIYSGAYSRIWKTGIVDYWTEKGADYAPVQDLLENDEAVITISEHANVTFLDTGYYPTVGSGGNQDNANEDSIAMCVKVGTKAIFMAGDLAIGSCEAKLMELNSNEDGDPAFFEDCDTFIVKTNHHAASSHGGNSEEFINWLAPDYVWTSSAIIEDNRQPTGAAWQHPPLIIVNRYINGIYGANYKEGVSKADACLRFFYSGTTGDLDFVFDDTKPEPTIHGHGRKKAIYYDVSGNLVDPETEKDLPFTETAFYQKMRTVM